MGHVQTIYDIRGGGGTRQCHKIYHGGRERVTQWVTWHFSTFLTILFKAVFRRKNFYFRPMVQFFEKWKCHVTQKGEVLAFVNKWHRHMGRESKIAQKSVAYYLNVLHNIIKFLFSGICLRITFAHFWGTHRPALRSMSPLTQCDVSNRGPKLPKMNIPKANFTS